MLWVLVAAAGVAMLAAWPAFRRWRGSVVVRAGLSPELGRRFGIFTDICFGVIAVLWTLGGLIGVLRG